MSVREFMDEHFRHFNAATVVAAARGWERHVDRGGRMMVTLAGAMSTAELGRSLAEMIRRGLVHAISCTGANLEEDLFNLVAHEHYVRLPDWRSLTTEDELRLCERGLNRVTDTCIPEAEAVRRVEAHLMRAWTAAATAEERRFPHEFFYELLRSNELRFPDGADPRHSWLLAAAERDLPLFVPGWEDSTTGNIFAARCLEGAISDPRVVRGGIEAMMELAGWYEHLDGPAGMFQIGGGIAGDFPICVVPLLRQDLERDVPLWDYFCQIGDSTTSYGSYSGALPEEKISWGKLGAHSQRFMIESDATIVAPLVFAYLLGD